jgi:hypothetical protein
VRDNSLFLRDNSLFRGALNLDRRMRNPGSFKAAERFSSGASGPNSRNSLHYSLLAGILTGERFASDSIHRQIFLTLLFPQLKTKIKQLLRCAEKSSTSVLPSLDLTAPTAKVLPGRTFSNEVCAAKFNANLNMTQAAPVHVT